MQMKIQTREELPDNALDKASFKSKQHSFYQGKSDKKIKMRMIISLRKLLCLFGYNPDIHYHNQ